MKKLLTLTALATVMMMAAAPAQAARVFGTLHGAKCVVCVIGNDGNGMIASVNATMGVNATQSGSCWVDTAAAGCTSTVNPSVLNPRESLKQAAAQATADEKIKSDRYDYKNGKIDAKSDRYDYKNDKIGAKSDRYDYKNDKADLKADRVAPKYDYKNDKIGAKSDRYDYKNDKTDLRADRVAPKYDYKNDKIGAKSDRYDYKNDKADLKADRVAPKYDYKNDKVDALKSERYAPRVDVSKVDRVESVKGSNIVVTGQRYAPRVEVSKVDAKVAPAGINNGSSIVVKGSNLKADKADTLTDDAVAAAAAREVGQGSKSGAGNPNALTR